ncbi:tyrosine-type recombinase/integrase [Blastomonas fulva]|nr:site-specific integrase [Blastomonas fulva]MDM7928816.1 site-specific integrase [Blastomonas fulva]MDM7964602.1 site-specific integrase [Blastomonas fulva]
MGARSTTKLTKRVCDNVEAEAGQFEVWDSELAGFGLRVMPSGVKSFIARYRSDGGGRASTRRTYTLGRYGALTVDQARKSAKAVLGAVANGADPGAKRNAKRGEMLVSDLCKLYEERGCFVQRGKRMGEPMKPLSKQYTLSRMQHHILPLLGRKRVGDVRAADVEQMVRDISDGKTAKDIKSGHRKRVIVRGGEGAARKAVQDLSAIFSFAMRYELVDRNPVATAAVRRTGNQRERFLTLAELQRLGKAFNELEAEGVSPKALNIMRLWTLTGCRRNEIAALRWDEVDLERGCLRLANSKTGKSIRPLGLAALTILKSVDREDGSEFVFPAGFGEGHFQGYKTPWRHAILKANLPGVSPHTLRHTMGSTAVSAGEALAFAGAILGHSNPRSTAIYAHVQHDPARGAADRISARIAAALAGLEEKCDDKVSAEGDDLSLLEMTASILREGGSDAMRLRTVLRAFCSAT